MFMLMRVFARVCKLHRNINLKMWAIVLSCVIFVLLYVGTVIYIITKFDICDHVHVYNAS
jgi:hypothetical protein